MKRSLRDDVRCSTRRRGVTLVEMLVTLAVLLLMMTAIVKIFQAATGSLSSAQAYQELDNQLRLLDSTIRSDLTGVTATMTPPNDPRNNLGYFEYGENEFADLQGEDSDDYIRFTAKAPAGRPFTGRMYVARHRQRHRTGLSNASFQPITITSEYAEIIYFLRNGNLYRRVLLVAPERQSTIVPTVSGNSRPTRTQQRRHDHGLDGNLLLQLHAGRARRLPGELAGRQRPLRHVRPHAGLASRANAQRYRHPEHPWRPDQPREQVRLSAVRQRFQDLTKLGPGGDGLARRLSMATTCPTITPHSIPACSFPQSRKPASSCSRRPSDATYTVRQCLALLAFPYVFPGAYSRAQTLSTDAFGWIHSPNPEVYDAVDDVGGSLTRAITLDYLRNQSQSARRGRQPAPSRPASPYTRRHGGVFRPGVRPCRRSGLTRRSRSTWRCPLAPAQ